METTPRTVQQVISEMNTICSQKRAIKLAAEFVLLHIKGPFRVSTLIKKFGDALDDLLIEPRN